jgi:YfiH family protein
MIEVVKPDWPAPLAVQACCTTRAGGFSSAPYDSLNVGLHVGDSAELVARNRARLREQLELPCEPCWINQTHGVHAVTLGEEDERNADAAIAREPGRIAVIMTADCLPILMCNQEGSEVAAVHAGWRGLQAGVIQSTLAAMHSSPQQLIAWIGPGISQACFEVGDEVYSAFVGQDPATARGFTANRPGHWLCDLGGLAESILCAAGVAGVTRSPHCSYLDAEMFFSYRREATTGRMASLIWIN